MKHDDDAAVRGESGGACFVGQDAEVPGDLGDGHDSLANRRSSLAAMGKEKHAHTSAHIVCSRVLWAAEGVEVEVVNSSSHTRGRQLGEERACIG